MCIFCWSFWLNRFWPRNSPLPSSRHLGSYTMALLVSQDRRHHFVNPLDLTHLRKFCTDSAPPAQTLTLAYTVSFSLKLAWTAVFLSSLLALVSLFSVEISEQLISGRVSTADGEGQLDWARGCSAVFWEQLSWARGCSTVFWEQLSWARGCSTDFWEQCREMGARLSCFSSPDSQWHVNIKNMFLACGLPLPRPLKPS